MSQQPRSAASSVLAFFGGSDPKYREAGIIAIIRFFVLLGFYGTVLITYWPTCRSGYQSYFRGLGNAAFEQFLIWPKASVHFLDLNSPNLIKNIRAQAPPLTLPESFAVPHRDKEMDTLMLLKNVDPTRPGLGQFRTSSRLIGYWSMVSVLALALATPAMWRRKLWLIVWSLLAVHVFVAFRLAISLLQGGFADPVKPYRLVDMDPWWFDKLKRFDAVLNDNVTFSFIGGVFVWLVVVIGLELWSTARQKIGNRFRLPHTTREAHRLDRISSQASRGGKSRYRR
jgi:hypothetical protein